MRFSIVTPSFRQFEWLKLNSASIQDQEGVELEHIIQDAGTGAELEAWAAGRPRTALHVEQDYGMFDAINRGWRRATGDFVAQLNCDEQYLPGALAMAGKMFEADPDLDVIYADSLIMDAAGNLKTYWKAIPLSGWRVAAGGISNPTAAIFFRRRILDQGFYFDPRWRCVGDAEWNRAVLAAGKKSATLSKPTSVYAVTGKNLSTTTASAKEIREWESLNPAWARWLKIPVRAYHVFLRRGLGNSPKAVPEVSYYLPGRAEKRHIVRNVTLSTRWPTELYSDAPPDPHRDLASS